MYFDIVYLIKESPFSAIATLSNDDTNEAIGTVKMDCCLNYGIFGYGKSLQVTYTLLCMTYKYIS